MIDGALCRWEDSTVFSQDGGKTWINRPSGAVLLHPGMDYQCRCTAIAYWDELVGEADAKIAEYEELDALSAANIAAMPKNANKIAGQNKSEAKERQRREENARATEKTAKHDYQNENWINAKIGLFKAITPDDLDKNLDGIKIANSKFPMGKDDERTLLKELKQAVILRDIGAIIYLLPKAKDAQGRNIPGPDAIVNGRIFEFKTITGGIGKVEKHFRDSRKQGGNVYIRIVDPKITRNDVIRKLSGVVNSDDYTGGFKGNVVFTVGTGKSGKTYFLRIKDLKR
jgi:hypothetical protein